EPGRRLKERRRRIHRPRAHCPQAADDCTGISQAIPACLLTILSGRMPRGSLLGPGPTSLLGGPWTLEPAASYQGALADSNATPVLGGHRPRSGVASGPRLDRRESGSGVPGSSSVTSQGTVEAPRVVRWLPNRGRSARSRGRGAGVSPAPSPRLDLHRQV